MRVWTDRRGTKGQCLALVVVHVGFAVVAIGFWQWVSSSRALTPLTDKFANAPYESAEYERLRALKSKEFRRHERGGRIIRYGVLVMVLGGIGLAIAGWPKPLPEEPEEPAS